MLLLLSNVIFGIIVIFVSVAHAVAAATDAAVAVVVVRYLRCPRCFVTAAGSGGATADIVVNVVFVAAIVFAAAIAPFATAALARDVTIVLWCFWYYNAAVIVVLLVG